MLAMSSCARSCLLHSHNQGLLAKPLTLGLGKRTRTLKFWKTLIGARSLKFYEIDSHLILGLKLDSREGRVQG
jgi:hypothetical protein